MKKHAMLYMITVALLGMSSVNYASGQESAKQETEKASAKEVHQKVDDTAEAIKNYSIEKRDEAAKKAKASLDALDAHINALEDRIDKNWDKMDQAARAQARSTMKALRERRVLVAEWYGALKNSGGIAWEDVKKGFSDAYKSLKESWEKAEQMYREDQKKDKK
jgi:CHASE3 domain sensor protein